MFADSRIPSGECGGRSVCRFKDSGAGGSVFADLWILGRGCGRGAFADLKILGRDDGGTSVCRFKDSRRGMWGEKRLQI